MERDGFWFTQDQIPKYEKRVNLSKKLGKTKLDQTLLDLLLSDNKAKEHFFIEKTAKKEKVLVFDKDNRVLLRKLCKEHGIVEDVYWSNTELFKKAKKYEVKGRGIANPAVAPIAPSPLTIIVLIALAVSL